MDEEFEMEEQNAEMPIEGMDLQALAATNPALAPFISRYFGAMDAESAALRQQAANKQQQFKAAEEAIRAQRFGAPTTSEQLLALGAAFLSPRRYTGLAGTLDKIVPVFGQMEQAQRSADEQRAAALEKLRREYLTGQDESVVAAARAKRDALGTVLPSVVSATKPQGMGQWSESLQRFIPKDRAVPVASGKLPDGRRVDKMSDGNMRALNNDGSYSYYDAGGNPINVGGQ